MKGSRLVRAVAILGKVCLVLIGLTYPNIFGCEPIPRNPTCHFCGIHQEATSSISQYLLELQGGCASDVCGAKQEDGGTSEGG